MSRGARALVFAAIFMLGGTLLGLMNGGLVDRVSQTPAGFVAYYVGYFLPYAGIGFAVGWFTRRTKKAAD